MNKNKRAGNYKSATLIIALLLLFSAALSADEDRYLTFMGRVIDSQSDNPLVFASVAVEFTNVATVTNLDGEFTLKVPLDQPSRRLVITHLGYNNRTISLNELQTGGYRNIISLEPAPTMLPDVTVTPVSGEDIIEKAIKRIPYNYTSEPNLMTGFYRETIRRRRSYVAIGEAVVQVFKAPYNSPGRRDGIRIYKGRQSTDVSRMDTLIFKLQGGPFTSLQLDVVKNPYSILDEESMQYYTYTLVTSDMIDDRPHYVIYFQQKANILSPLFYGRMYVDKESYAISEIDFALNLTNINEAKEMLVRRKPFTADVEPDAALYRVVYREYDGKWYFAYSRAEVSFTVNWRRRIFNTNFTTMSELAITDRTTDDVIRFAGRDRVRFTDVFSERVSDFEDPDFWGDYNVIEPDQTIERAIERLSRRLRIIN